MSETEKVNPEDQLKAVRNALISSVFEKYHQLMDIIKMLPLSPELPALHKAYLDIDTGLVWIKEMLSSSPLVFPQPKNQENPEEKPEVAA